MDTVSSLAHGYFHWPTDIFTDIHGIGQLAILRSGETLAGVQLDLGVAVKGLS